mgnify:CR=1 FL=1
MTHEQTPFPFTPWRIIASAAIIGASLVLALAIPSNTARAGGVI